MYEIHLVYGNNMFLLKAQQHKKRDWCSWDQLIQMHTLVMDIIYFLQRCVRYSYIFCCRRLNKTNVYTQKTNRKSIKHNIYSLPQAPKGKQPYLWSFVQNSIGSHGYPLTALDLKLPEALKHYWYLVLPGQII